MAKDKKDFVEDEQSKEPQFSEIKETIIDENIPEEGKEKKKKKEYYRFYIYFTITNRIYSFYGVSINIFISN